MRAVACADLAAIFIKGDIAHPVKTLDGPVLPDQVSESWTDVRGGFKAADSVDGLFVPQAPVQVSDLSVDAKGRGGVREADVVRELTGDTDRACLDPTVTFVPLTMRGKKTPSRRPRDPRAGWAGSSWR